MSKTAQEMLRLSKHYLAQPIENEDDMRELVELLHFHENQYYVQDNPLITDTDYDLLYKKLERYEEGHPAQVLPNSPTQRVGSDAIAGFDAVTHLEPMLSLANSYNEADLKAFDEQLHKWTDTAADTPLNYAVEPKFDGGTVVLVYENDMLVRAATRGNGSAGDEITHNVRTFKTVPLRANFSQLGIRRVELRGEAIISKDKFEQVNAARAAEGLNLFANPRNAATGGLRTKDPSDSAHRGIEVFVYQMGYIEPTELGMLEALDTHSKRVAYLGELGFKIPPTDELHFYGIEAVVAYCKAWEEKRASYPYEIDGMVVKLDAIAQQDALGNTAHHPRWAIAYKFKAKQAMTTLESVDYQVGRTGAITPVAKVADVALAGVTISSISLHNAEFISSKDLHYQDQVLIERAGDVIPYIVKAFPELRPSGAKAVVFPTHCPIAPAAKAPELVQDEGEAVIRCPHCICGAQDKQRMTYFVSKDAMDIDGLGAAQIERFYDLGMLHDITDIYRLDYAQIAQLDNFGAKSAQNLEQSIARSKRNPIHRLLIGLSIPHLGKKAAKLIVERIKNLKELLHWEEAQYTDIDGIGPVIATQATSWFHTEANQAMLAQLEELGVNMEQLEEDRAHQLNTDGPLAGKTILFTGTLTQLKRSEAQKLATAAGAKNISAVSKNLNILVAGENAGSKLTKAEALGTVEIWSEHKFIEELEKG